MGFMGFGWLPVLVALAAVVCVVTAAGRGRGESAAEQRLKERYAAGEVDRATYERMLADLRK